MSAPLDSTNELLQSLADGSHGRQGWIDRGKKIAAVDSNRRFEIGDWLAEGNKWCRDLYAEAAAILTDHTPEELRVLCCVARSVPTLQRNNVLSWSHHAAVARFRKAPETQKELLDHAAENKMPVAAFREHISEKYPIKAKDKPEPKPTEEPKGEPEPGPSPNPEAYIRITLHADTMSRVKLLSRNHKHTIAEVICSLVDQALELPATQDELAAFSAKEAA
jgi:hypothetical protein